MSTYEEKTFQDILDERYIPIEGRDRQSTHECPECGCLYNDEEIRNNQDVCDSCLDSYSLLGYWRTFELKIKLEGGIQND